MANVCPGIPVNPDISGPGVRIALYLQSLLSVILVRISPKDAPGAYWSMTSTAMSLIISSIVTGAQGTISLLDAIVVVYVLILPIVASASGVSQLAFPTTSSTSLSSSRLYTSTKRQNSLRRAPSPLLILFNWLRSALTYSFALFVWVTAPTFGHKPHDDADLALVEACNRETKLIFFGAKLNAVGAGRTLNLVGWSILTAFFAWRSVRGTKTLFAALNALSMVLGGSGNGELVKPKTPPKNELNLETVDRYDFATGESEHRERAYRPGPVFHEMLRGMMSQILGLAPRGSGSFYARYGQLTIAALISIWAIIMTELELALNTLEEDVNHEWGFGQILPLILTISPLLSLCEALLARRARGPLGLDNKRNRVRFTIHSGTNLARPGVSYHLFNPSDDQVDMHILHTRALSQQIPPALSKIILAAPNLEALTSGPHAHHPSLAITDDERRQTRMELIAQEERRRAPTAFVVLTIDDMDIYTTYEIRDTRNPVWKETFEVDVSDISTVVVRVFDVKSMERYGWRRTHQERDAEVADSEEAGGGLVGHVALMPSTLLCELESNNLEDSKLTATSLKRSFPLLKNDRLVPGMTVELGISTDLEGPIPLPEIPAQYVGMTKVQEKRKVSMIKYKGKRVGQRHTRLTETYNLGNGED